MQVAIIALSALVVLVEVQDGQAWLNSPSMLDYDAINHMLVQNVPTDDIAANMAVAKKAYEKRIGGKRNAFMKALEKFVALDTIATRERCNLAGYDILNAVDVGTRGQARGDPIRRIDKIVQFYIKEHSILCQNFYPQLIEAKKTSVDKQTLGYINSLIEGIIKSRQIYYDCHWFDPVYQDDIFKSFTPTKVLKVAAEGDPDIKYLDLVADQEQGKMVVNESKRKELFNKYIYQPCVGFNEEVGEDYRHVLGFDYATFHDDCSDGVRDKLAIYICHRFVHDKNARKTVIAALLRSR